MLTLYLVLRIKARIYRSNAHKFVIESLDFVSDVYGFHPNNSVDEKTKTVCLEFFVSSKWHGFFFPHIDSDKERKKNQKTMINGLNEKWPKEETKREKYVGNCIRSFCLFTF